MSDRLCFIFSTLDQVGVVSRSEVNGAVGAASVSLKPESRMAVESAESYVLSGNTTGIVLEASRSRIGWRCLRVLDIALSKGLVTYVYWRGDGVLDKVDRALCRRLRLRWLRQYIARRIGGDHFANDSAGDWPAAQSRIDSSVPAEMSELDTILLHLSDVVEQLDENMKGVEQTRLSAAYYHNRAEQLSNDLDVALERVMGHISNAAGAIDGTEVDARRDEMRALRDGVKGLSESLQVIDRVLHGHRDYLQNGVELVRKFDKHMRAGGLTGAVAISTRDIPDYIQRLKRAQLRAKPVTFDACHFDKEGELRIEGSGVYLRLDYWAPMISGGSYGHTAYVVKNLDRVSDGFGCAMANPLPLLDELGIRQVSMESPTANAGDVSILNVGLYYESQLRPGLALSRPAYIYERLSLGNLAGASLSQELQIPYIVEYNGSEISLRRSFEGRGYDQEKAFLAVEELAFAQATLITVVSEHIKADLLERGVPEEKILVNPNCVDVDVYAPGTKAEITEIRKELKVPEDRTVVGFIGSFGGWHGIDILAEALKPVLDQSKNAHFLLIGDGSYRSLVEEQIERHGLADRVTMTGRVSQEDGARFLKACDIFVSPHSSHMVDRKFFGSPTKLFEYMAMGGGVIASDLEQIGEVMRPSFTADELTGSLTVKDQRGVLCKPGDKDDFVKAVVGLVSQPKLCESLGRNARSAAKQFYTWELHVENLFRHMKGMDLVGYVLDLKK